VTLLCLWTLAARAQEARTWELDPAASTLFVIVRHDASTALSGMAHDHAVTATGWSGKVTWDPADPGACDIHVVVPVGGLVVDPPGMRERAGLEGDTDETDKPKILDNLWSARQLDKSRFPSIEFSSTSCAGAGTAFTVKGTLTMHGVAKELSVPMTIVVDGDHFSAAGAFDTTGTTFGFQPYTAAMGMIRNLDGLSFTIDVRGR
jgi:polyisoprenoid-binding protein YceI